MVGNVEQGSQQGPVFLVELKPWFLEDMMALAICHTWDLEKTDLSGFKSESGQGGSGVR